MKWIEMKRYGASHCPKLPSLYPKKISNISKIHFDESTSEMGNCKKKVI